MPTALDSSFDLGGMRHTATASNPFVRLVSMGLALRLTTIYHETSGLTFFPPRFGSISLKAQAMGFFEPFRFFLNEVHSR